LDWLSVGPASSLSIRFCRCDGNGRFRITIIERFEGQVSLDPLTDGEMPYHQYLFLPA
jgi:hypothetical protein